MQREVGSNTCVLSPLVTTVADQRWAWKVTALQHSLQHPLSGPSLSSPPDILSGHEKAPQASDLEGEDGARGIRTPKPFRALAFEASAIPFCQRSKQQDADVGVGRRGRGLWRISVVPRRSLGSTSACQEAPSYGASRRSNQSGRPDSNRGPLRPERSALPD